jgi:hypothetical protein
MRHRLGSFNALNLLIEGVKAYELCVTTALNSMSTRVPRILRLDRWNYGTAL